jgi:GNAT superfamily N-acetyltransferase
MITVRAYRDSDTERVDALDENDPIASGPLGSPRQRSADLSTTFAIRLAFWVAVDAEDDTDVVGTVALRPPDDDTPPELVADKRVAMLVNYRVSPDRQRQGIGRLLMESLLAWSKAQAYDSVIVNATLDRDAAMGVYRAFGFREAAHSVRDGEEMLWFEIGFPANEQHPSTPSATGRVSL